MKPKSKRKQRFDIDTAIFNLLILLLIIIAIISVVMLRDFVGYVGYHGAKGGQITSVNIYQMFPASIWNGIFGITLAAPSINSSWYVFANPAGMSEINAIFPCFEPGRTHELYATTLDTADIDWFNVTAGTTQMLDDYVGISYSAAMSATQTFTHTITVELGDTTISNVPAAYMRQYNIPDSTAFPVGILQYDGTIIMVALINSNYILGYRPGKIFNFEMMVPVPYNVTNLRYNLYTDPFDRCPAGDAGDSFNPGNVYGWVSVNGTDTFLDNVLVAAERKIYITAADGFYNITLQPGTYFIVAMKAGFVNYVGNVTIYESNATEHNITMVVYEEPLTGTGPGVGTGVGPGIGPGVDVGPGIGPGVGPGIGPYIERPQDFGIDHFISLDRLHKRLRIGNFFTENIIMFNFRREAARVQISVSGNASRILELSDTSATIEQNEHANVSVRGFGIEKGIYRGYIEFGGDFNDTIPVEIIVTDEERLPIEALLIQLEVLSRRPLPGNIFRFKVNMHNLLTEEKFDVRLDYYIRGVEASTANYSMYVGNDTISLHTAHSQITDVAIPPDWPKGDYFLIVEARYYDLYSRTSTIFELFEPLHMHKVFGLVELWKILLALGLLAIIIGTVWYIRRRISSQKRFHAKVEYNLLPKKGPRSLYVGKIAETENDTYFDMDKLTVHSIIAGSTGGGKSISAQVIIEECLLKGVSVIVFDPTAQWTGMLRKCTDEKMMQFYPRFHLTKKDAKAFSGNIRAIKNPREKIDLMKYWKPGEIQVITTSTLDPKDMDIFVANTVREVFHSNLQEFRGLRMMMVYDEVHRLLPKFGGSGEGFIQIERACREFRKWGIGVMLVSQVLADFVGQIKANINTEIQMKTRDEGDLQRIETKYGKSYIQELVKAPVGSGMVQNSDWNRGKPYYITFRPILHSVVRLTDEELEQYNKYNEMVDDLSYQLDQLEQEGKDVFDLRLELKLSLDKIKSGSFNMVEIYIEGLAPRIQKIWKELGKTPKKRSVQLVSEDELKKAITAAKSESDKVKTESAPAGGGEAEKKALGLNDDVAPDKMLKLLNGTLVIKLKALLDEIKVLKEDEFSKHVNAEKNDFSDWIRDAIGNDKWADLADQILTKADYIAFLEALDQGKEKQFKPATAREKPYSSKKGEAKPEEKVEAKPEEKVEAKPEEKVEAKPEEKVEAKPEEKVEAKPEEKVEAKPEEKVEAKPEEKVEAKPEEKVEAKPEEKVEAKPEEKVEAKPEEKVEAKPEEKVEAKPEEAIIEPVRTEEKPAPVNLTEVRTKLAAMKPEGKLDYLKTAYETNMENTDIMFLLAAEYHRKNDYPNAELFYKKILDINPDNPKVLYYLGSLYNGQKKFDMALEAFQKVIKLQPDYPKAKEYIDSLNKILGPVQ
jgi:tetratricopeptide (TPR) repeat protein